MKPTITCEQCGIEMTHHTDYIGANMHRYDFFQAIGLIHNTTEYEDNIREYIEGRVAALSA